MSNAYKSCQEKQYSPVIVNRPELKKYDCYYITYHATRPLYNDDPYKSYLYAKNNGDRCSTLIAGALSIALLEVWCASNGIKVDYYTKIVDDKYGRHFIKEKPHI